MCLIQERKDRTLPRTALESFIGYSGILSQLARVVKPVRQWPAAPTPVADYSIAARKRAHYLDRVAKFPRGSMTLSHVKTVGGKSAGLSRFVSRMSRKFSNSETEDERLRKSIC